MVYGCCMCVVTIAGIASVVLVYTIRNVVKLALLWQRHTIHCHRPYNHPHTTYMYSPLKSYTTYNTYTLNLHAHPTILRHTPAIHLHPHTIFNTPQHPHHLQSFRTPYTYDAYIILHHPTPLPTPSLHTILNTPHSTRHHIECITLNTPPAP